LPPARIAPERLGGDNPAHLARLGSAAADCLSRAIMRAIIAAEPLGGYSSWRQMWGTATA
jgi:L-aminopeptidase/D-esterase-like protein